VVVADEYTRPLTPTPRPPTARDERYRDDEIVEEPVEKKPFAPVKPMAVVVELYPVLTVNGKVAEEMVTGEEPMMVKLEHDVPPPHEAEVVATPPNLAGVPLVVVQYESCPIVSLVEVETELM